MNNEEKILGMLETMTADMSEIKADMSEVKDRLGRVESRLDKVEGSLGKVESRLDKVESRLDKVESRLGKVESRLDFVEESLAETRDIVDRTHKSVVVIENDHGEMLKYLRDGYNNNTAKLISIEKKVNRHEKILVGSVS